MKTYKNFLDKLINEVTLKGCYVFLRLDLNVPLSWDNKRKAFIITNKKRIISSLPTIIKLANKEAKIVILSHLGRPSISKETGKVNSEDRRKYSLDKITSCLKTLIDFPVDFSKELLGSISKNKIKNMHNSEILVLENLRFDIRESSKIDTSRESFVRDFLEVLPSSSSKKKNIFYVNDAFGVIHRKHASVYDLPLVLPSYYGYLIYRELEMLNRLINEPLSPYTVILGGSKIIDKLDVIKSLLPKANAILIGGGMSFTCLKSLGYKIGSSLCDNKQLLKIRNILLSESKSFNCDIVLPKDFIITNDIKNENSDYFSIDVNYIEKSKLGKHAIGVDIGPITCKIFQNIIFKSKTIFWNGPMGIYENKNFQKGTFKIAQSIKRCKNNNFSIIGGGDSIAAINKFKFTEKDYGYISTGGGASLRYLGNRNILPGLFPFYKK